MGELAMALTTDTTTTPPATHITPFLPQSQHPSTQDVDQMINSRIANAVEQLRGEFHSHDSTRQRNREITIGLVGLAGGALVVYTANKIVVSRRNRANAAGR